MEKSLDSVVLSGELLCIKTFACINNGRLKINREGQNHLDSFGRKWFGAPDRETSSLAIAVHCCPVVHSYISHLETFLMAHPPKPAKQPSANKKPASIPTFAVLTVLLLAAIAFLFPQTDSRFPSHPWKTVGKLLKGSEVEMNNPKRTVGYFVGVLYLVQSVTTNNLM